MTRRAMVLCRLHRASMATIVLGVTISCASADHSDSIAAVTEPASAATTVVSLATTLEATVGSPFTYDATRNAAAFRQLRTTGLTFRVVFTPTANGLSATAGRISGVPLSAGTITATITATDLTRRSATDVVTIVVTTPTVVLVASANSPQGATVGSSFNFDATKGGTTFSGTSLTYAVAFSPTPNGLAAVNGRIVGVPAATGTTLVTVVATDASGRTASNTFPIVAFGADLTAPTMPATPFAYADATAPLPAHFSDPNGPGGAIIRQDNTPANNRTSDAGAALGRVLFYDRRLSVNDRVSCASCHQQEFAFGDTARLSTGFAGGSTGRHSMGLQNARFYQRGRFFWDERAATLEAQVLAPIQDATEMGMTLDNLMTKLALSPYYATLFQSAFGTTDVTSDRVSRALAQFVRSLTSGTSKFDQAFTGGAPNFNAVFTAEELQGQQLFNGQAGCVRCHTTFAHVSDDIHNTGLDAVSADVGAGQGRFKAPSLRNIAVGGRFMHDGRFTSLEQVVEFYNSGVQANANLDNRLRGNGGNGGAQRLNLRTDEKAALVTYLRTLTDPTFLTAARFADPFTR